METTALKQTAIAIDTDGVMRMIPHRYPFLMIDRIIDLIPGVGATGIKNVSINEPYFQGHFPARPVMPGVLLIEAMAQTAAVVVVHALGEQFQGKLVYFMSVENARFRKPVLPGSTLHVHVTRQHNRGNVWKFSGEAKVDGTLVAEAVYTAMILDA
jgi:3-hydroxyacyl-[acyl-carrier-protein] dehydratase